MKYIFGITIALFFLPSIDLGLIPSHGIAKLLLLYLVTKLFFSNKLATINHKMPKSVFTVIGLYFVTQILSVINAIDYTAYYQHLENTIFTFMVLLVSIYFSRVYLKQKFPVFIAWPLLFSAGLTIVIKSILFLKPDLFYSLIQPWLFPGFGRLVAMNLNRQRVYLGTYEEIVLPIIGLLYLKKTIQNRYLTLLFIIPIIFSVVITNFRSRLLMLVFSLCGTLLMFRKHKKQLFSIIMIFVLLVVSYLSLLIVREYSGRNLYDRFMFASQVEDVNTVQVRIDQLGEVIELASVYPVFGIGLGQYAYYISNVYPLSLRITASEDLDIIRDARYPHNIFLATLAETGYLGLFSFVMMIFYFLKLDIELYLKKDVNNIAIIISFWTLFIYALFNPVYNISYSVIFWCLRGYLLVNYGAKK